MQNKLAKDLLPHAIMLFVIEYAKRHEIKVDNGKGILFLKRLKVISSELFEESEA